MSELRAGADTLTLPAQFGVRFYDPLSGLVVADGLRVRLWRPDNPARLIEAAPTRGGFFVAHPLGLADLALPRRWRAQVTDTLGRFLPLLFDAAVPLPAPQALELASPPGVLAALEERADLPLFSAPTRRVPPGAGLVQADLRTLDGRPAAWAVVAAQAVVRGAADALLGVGMADRGGALTLALRLPSLGRAGDGVTLEQPVTLRLHAFYAPGDGPAPAAPELAAALAQPEALLLGRRSPSVPLGDLEIRAGRPLALSTLGAAHLLIVPAT